MAANLIVLAAVVAICCAKPFYFSALPGVTILRAGRSPSIAYGFGSGFASDIGGIKHSNSIGASFQTGDAEAFGAGIGSTNGNTFASGVGYAHTNPNTYRTAYPAFSAPTATPYYSYPFNLGYNHFRAPQLRDSYGNPVSSGPQQNFGTSIAQAQNGPFGSVASAANFSPYRFGNSGFGGSAVSTAVSNGYGASAVSSANNFGQATSLAQTRDEQGGFNAAVAAAENVGGVGGSTAQTVQQNGRDVQHSGATSINGGPGGIQASHSHAVNTGAGTYY